MLKIENVSKTYGKTAALSDVRLAVRKGEFVSIVGPSGCGKSTLLKIVAGLIEPSKGHIVLKDRLQHTGIVFQDHVLLPWRTVEENVSLPIELGRGEGVTGALRLVGLERFRHHYPAELSGGMQQRCAIARALVANSSLLLMDEPFGSLDEITRRRMNTELLRVKERLGLTVLFVTHSLQEAVILSDRIMVLSARPGRIKRVLRIGLPHRHEGVEETPQFQRYVRCVRRLLE